MKNKQPYFVTKAEQREKNLYFNTGACWTIGRAADNSFAFEDLSMSRRHAVVQALKPGKFYIFDLAVNNAVIPPTGVLQVFNDLANISAYLQEDAAA